MDRKIENRNHEQAEATKKDIEDLYNQCIDDLTAITETYADKLDRRYLTAREKEAWNRSARALLADAGRVAVVDTADTDTADTAHTAQANAVSGTGTVSAVSAVSAAAQDTALARAVTLARLKTTDAMRLLMNDHVAKLYGGEADKVDVMGQDITARTYYYDAWQIQRNVGVVWKIVPYNDRQWEAVRDKRWADDEKTWVERIAGKKAQTLNVVDKALKRMVITGGDPTEAIKTISKNLNVSRARSGTLVMTEASHFYSGAQEQAFNELGVERFRFVATLDTHTTPVCQHMDGQTFDMDEYEEGVTAPPLHYNCRSVTAPYYEGVKSTRAARDREGKTVQVDSDLTYKDWAKLAGVKPRNVADDWKPDPAIKRMFSN